MYQTVGFRSCLCFFSSIIVEQWVYKMLQACNLVLVCKHATSLYLVAGLQDGAVLYIEGQVFTKVFPSCKVWLPHLSKKHQHYIQNYSQLYKSQFELGHHEGEFFQWQWQSIHLWTRYGQNFGEDLQQWQWPKGQRV